jgi:hypothetical protein
MSEAFDASRSLTMLEHRRAKTDRLDTELLMRAFIGWLRGEKRHCNMVAFPAPDAHPDMRLKSADSTRAPWSAAPRSTKEASSICKVAQPTTRSSAVSPYPPSRYVVQAGAVIPAASTGRAETLRE